MIATRRFTFAAILLVLGAASLPSRAPADDMAVAKPIKLVPVWHTGETFRYELARVVVTRKGADEEPTRSTARTPVEVEVIEADSEGFVLRWTQGSATFDDPKLSDDPLVKSLSTIYKGIDIDLELDTDGVYTGVRNWKEVKATGHKLQDLMLKSLEKAKVAKATIDTVRVTTDKLFVDKVTVEEAFGKQPSLLVRPLGRVYDPDKPATYDDTFPNPIPGGEPIPTKGERSIKVLDTEAGLVRVTYKQLPDQKDVNRIMEQSLRDDAKKRGQPAPEVFPEFKLEDVIEYEIELKTGWVRSVTHTRTITVGDQMQSEVITLTRKEW